MTHSSPRRIPSVNYEDAFDWRKTESIRFVVQITLSSAVLGLCIWQLVARPDQTDKALYWGGITSVIAWWMPSPGGSSSKSDSSLPTASSTELEGPAIYPINGNGHSNGHSNGNGKVPNQSMSR